MRSMASRRSDVVFQGASVAFDLSMEEIWIPYLVGATLFVATPRDHRRDRAAARHSGRSRRHRARHGADAARRAAARCAERCASIILGGEACPPSVAERWCRPGRTIFNSYGPTEATVVATVAEVWPNEPVTIGRPIPNYTCYVVDDALELLDRRRRGRVADRRPGRRARLSQARRTDGREIHRQSVRSESGDPDPLSLRRRRRYRRATAISAFAAASTIRSRSAAFASNSARSRRRSSHQPGIAPRRRRAAQRRRARRTRRLSHHARGRRRRTARAARRAARRPAGLHGSLRASNSLDRCRKLPSGKVDRKALEAHRADRRSAVDEEQEEPRNETEAKLLEAAKRVLPPQRHSLRRGLLHRSRRPFAARGALCLRGARNAAPRRDHAAGRLRASHAARAGGASRRQGGIDRRRSDLSFTPPPLLRRFLCGLGAGDRAAVHPRHCHRAMARRVRLLHAAHRPPTRPCSRNRWRCSASIVCINIATVALSIIGKWLVIGRTKPGRYPLWGVYYYRWWLAQRFMA